MNYELVVENSGDHQFVFDTVRVILHSHVSNAVVYLIEADPTQIEQLRTFITEHEVTFTLNRMDE
jgi:hypothetical protein